jgi:hypothetical protein
MLRTTNTNFIVFGLSEFYSGRNIVGMDKEAMEKQNNNLVNA